MAVIDRLTTTSAPGSDAINHEKRGRKWLMASFLFCPCHLPVIMTVLGVLFGGSTFGVLVGRNTLGVGIVFGVIYVILLAIGFRHLRSATKGVDCSNGECTIPT